MTMTMMAVTMAVGPPRWYRILTTFKAMLPEIMLMLMLIPMVLMPRWIIEKTAFGMLIYRHRQVRCMKRMMKRRHCDRIWAKWGHQGHCDLLIRSSTAPTTETTRLRRYGSEHLSTSMSFGPGTCSSAGRGPKIQMEWALQARSNSTRPPGASSPPVAMVVPRQCMHRICADANHVFVSTANGPNMVDPFCFPP